MSRTLLRLNAAEYIVALGLASIATSLLLFEQVQLASRAGLQVDILGLVLLQQTVMAILILCVAFAGVVRVGWRWLFALFSTMFAGFVGTRLATTFNATLELAGPLQSRGIPISDYQGAFYVLALGAAVTYILAILVLRRSYGKLMSVRMVETSLSLEL